MPIAQPFSRCNGKKRALVIGINYTHHPDPSFRLGHAVDDAYCIANFLRENLGFAPDDVRVMTDNNHPWDQPDKVNIMSAMSALVRDAQPDDSLFCYFSGHAVQMEDVIGLELDGRSESMCAVDYLGGEQWPNKNVDTPGLVVDTEMHRLMVQPLPPRCRLTAIYDCCHSGTLLNLPHIYDSNGGVKEPKLRYSRRREILHQRSSHADVVSLIVGHNHQETVETNLGGALRWAFIKCMKQYQSNVTYKQLMESAHDHMKRYRFPQEPQLSSSLEIDINSRFLI